jgi:tetrameric-type glycyl-tRNA synthetase beta subunit
MKNFLLEIGCEELPSDYMPNALDWNYPNSQGLAAAAQTIFSDAKLIWAELQVFGTPRRLVLRVSGVEPVVREEMEGPPVSVAFDAAGKPTEAGLGFAKRQNVAMSALKKKETARGPRLVLERSIPAEKVLAASIPAIIQKIAFPKTMRWDNSGVRFARPIRWLTAFYGDKKIPVSYGDLRSDAATQSSRQGGLIKKIPVKNLDAYDAALKKSSVRLEQGCRLKRKPDGSVQALPFEHPKRDALHKQLTKSAGAIKAALPEASSEEMEWLLNTVTFLAENPFVAAGSFQKEYLELPPEVLATSMAKHLKLFSVRSPDGSKLMPRFLAVLEGAPSKPADVMSNYDRIIEARFTDARFFYREDTKTPLEQKTAELQKVVFHEKLGSVGERVAHLERLMKLIVTTCSISGVDSNAIHRAALLCKADLVTQMVREFPTLQGVIGGYYAKQSGESSAVAAAISEQYRPRSAGDALPKTALGALVSLADRFDTLIGYFGAGMKPTSSVDPYALRRHAIGLVRILLEPPAGVSFAGLSIDRILDDGIESWGLRITLDRAAVKREIRAFLKERLEWMAVSVRGIDRDCAAAVLAAGFDDPADLWKRMQIVSKKNQPLERSAKIAERCGRIVQSVKGLEIPSELNAELFKEAAEQTLGQQWLALRPKLQQHLSARQYEQALAVYSELHPAVHAFFEKVFVMDENLDVRRNRLALLQQIHRGLAATFADLSKLPLSGTE